MMLVALLALFLLQGAAFSQSFYFNASFSLVPGLQVDSIGRAFLVADNYLYRLNAQLMQEERVDLGAFVINRGLALSSTGKVVVCFDDLSCSVYNASNLSAGPMWSVSNAIARYDSEAAIFTSGETFYTGASTGIGERMVLQQFGEKFSRSSDNNASDTHNKLVSNFKREFYGGFVSGDFAYYVVIDSRPIAAQAIRLLRICNMPDCGGPSTCGVTALYELGFGSNKIKGSTRVCGVSLIEDFGAKFGPTAVITICKNRNWVFRVNVTAVNEAMDAKYDSCIVSRTVGEEIGLIWRTGSSESCDILPQSQVCIVNYYKHYHFILQVTGDRCDTHTPVGMFLNSVRAKTQIKHKISASVAVKVEQFSFLFLFVANNDDNRIFGVSLWLSQLMCIP